MLVVLFEPRFALFGISIYVELGFVLGNSFGTSMRSLPRFSVVMALVTRVGTLMLLLLVNKLLKYLGSIT